MSTELGIRDVAFEVDDLQAAIDRVAADGNGRKTRLVMRVLPRLPSDCRFSLGGRPENQARDRAASRALALCI
jgi:hypothetical protein